MPANIKKSDFDATFVRRCQTWLSELETARRAQKRPVPQLFQRLAEKNGLDLAHSILAALPRNCFGRKSKIPLGDVWQPIEDQLFGCGPDQASDLGGASVSQDSVSQDDWCPFDGDRLGPWLLLHSRRCKNTWSAKSEFDHDDFRNANGVVPASILNRIEPWLARQGHKMPSDILALNRLIVGEALRPATAKDGALPPNTPFSHKAEQNLKSLPTADGATSPDVAAHNRLVLEFVLWPILRLPEEGEVVADLGRFYESVRKSAPELFKSLEEPDPPDLLKRVNLLLTLANRQPVEQETYDGAIDLYRPGRPPLWTNLMSDQEIDRVATTLVDDLEQDSASILRNCGADSEEGRAVRARLLQARREFFGTQGGRNHVALDDQQLRQLARTYCRRTGIRSIPAREQSLHFIDHVIYQGDASSSPVDLKISRAKENREISKRKIRNLITKHLIPAELQRLTPKTGAPPPDDEGGPAPEISEPIAPEPTDGDLLDLIEKGLERLDERQRKILELRYGLRGHEQHTFDQIGQEFGLTGERIRQIHDKAIESLKAYLKGSGEL